MQADPGERPQHGGRPCVAVPLPGTFFTGPHNHPLARRLHGAILNQFIPFEEPPTVELLLFSLETPMHESGRTSFNRLFPSSSSLLTWRAAYKAQKAVKETSPASEDDAATDKRLAEEESAPAATPLTACD